jgi:hypothetical protein
LGVLTAAKQALKQNVKEIAVIEFGVAGGNGLVALQKEAQAVEEATGVAIKVYGFDMGPLGLPAFISDHRDHPDEWREGDVPALQPRLDARTTGILGNIQETAAPHAWPLKAGIGYLLFFGLLFYLHTRCFSGGHLPRQSKRVSICPLTAFCNPFPASDCRPRFAHAA